MMKITRISRDEFGQMLLATGIVLLMSLLSMAIFSVKLAGMSMPYEPNSTGVLDVSQEVLATIEPVTQARYDMWVEQGIDEEEAAVLALDSVNNDLLHHGELRGVEVKLIDIQYTETTEGVEISFNLGVSDDDARLEVDYSFILE